MTMSRVAWTRVLAASVLFATIALALPADAADGLSAHIVLPFTTMPAGSTMHGTLVIENSGRAVTGTGCGGVPEAVLSNGTITQTLACAMGGGWRMRSIPAGESTWPMTLLATYTQCGGERGRPPRCTASGDVPPLPAGIYHVVVIDVDGVVPVPPITVRITP
jgi:hypothetical protein